MVTGAAASATVQHVVAHVWGQHALKGKEGGETDYLFPGSYRFASFMLAALLSTAIW